MSDRRFEFLFIRILASIALFLFIFIFSSSPLVAEARPLRIGIISSLSGFASSYGQAVLDGAHLAQEELHQSGALIELAIEDDQSDTRNALSAYTKLKTIDKISALIGGSWWVNSIAKRTEVDSIPFLSCETLFDKGFIRAATYFSLAGDLRDWVRVYEPLIAEKGLSTAVTVKFASGFGDTIAEEMERIFSIPGRRHLAALEYSDINMAEAPTLLAQIAAKKPQAIYLDAQPASFSNFVRRMRTMQISNITVFANSVAHDALESGIISGQEIENLYFTRRQSYQPAFVEKFKRRFGVAPQLGADLGYYAVFILKQAFADGHEGALSRIKEGNIAVDGIRFQFDENNVWRGIAQEIYEVRKGQILRYGGS